MEAAAFTSALALGFLGSAHCFAMCGGIACALNLALAPAERRAKHRFALCIAGYQLGRILSYGIAGAIAAGLGGGLFSLLPPAAAPRLGIALQALVLIGLGLYLTGHWRTPLARLEAAGARLWGALAPLRRRLLPVRGPGGALRMGLVWGWLPCGLVYSALLFAFSTGRWWSGALYMLAFGLGTLPALLAASGAASWVKKLRTSQTPRRVVGWIMMSAGVFLGLAGIAHAHGGGDLLALEVLADAAQWCVVGLR